MNLDLKDLGATLVTGAYFPLGLLFLFCLFSGWKFRHFLKLAKEVASAPITILVLSLAFGVGMLLEDISYQVLPLRNLRTEALFGEAFIAPPEKRSGAPPRPAPLSQRAADLGLLARSGPQGLKVQEAVKNKNPNAATAGQLREVAATLYYTAKNAVFRVPNYYDELRGIQTRIDFSRSFAILSSFLGFFSVIFATVALVFPTLGARTAARIAYPHRIVTRRAVIGREVLLLAGLVTILGVAGFAFSSEGLEFDKRVYGYFFSLVESGVIDSSENEKASPNRKEAPPNTPVSSPTPTTIGYSAIIPIEEQMFAVPRATNPKTATSAGDSS